MISILMTLLMPNWMTIFLTMILMIPLMTMIYREGEKAVFELNNFDSIRIGLASPEKIREWSRGEVKNPRP